MKIKKAPMYLSVKDMMMITGKCKATVCRIRAATRKRFNKPALSEISIEEFCAFTGLNEEKVKAMLE